MVTYWGADSPKLAVAWLFGTEPTDRALAGWAPQQYVRQCYGTFLRFHTGDPPLPPASAWPSASAGEAANSA